MTVVVKTALGGGNRNWCALASSGIDFYNQRFDFIAYSADAWVPGDGVAAALEAIGKGCV